MPEKPFGCIYICIGLFVAIFFSSFFLAQCTNNINYPIKPSRETKVGKYTVTKYITSDKDFYIIKNDTTGEEMIGIPDIGIVNFNNKIEK